MLYNFQQIVDIFLFLGVLLSVFWSVWYSLNFRLLNKEKSCPFCMRLSITHLVDLIPRQTLGFEAYALFEFYCYPTSVVQRSYLELHLQGYALFLIKFAGAENGE